MNIRLATIKDVFFSETTISQKLIRTFLQALLSVRASTIILQKVIRKVMNGKEKKPQTNFRNRPKKVKK